MIDANVIHTDTSIDSASQSDQESILYLDRTRSECTAATSIPNNANDPPLVTRQRSNTAEPSLTSAKERLYQTASASASDAALVALPPPTPTECGKVNSAEEDEDIEYESRRHTLVAPIFPVIEDGQCSLSSSSSMSLGRVERNEPSFSPLGTVDSTCPLDEQSLHLIHQLKAISESELRRTGFSEIRSTEPPLRHVASLNLLGTSGTGEVPSKTVIKDRRPRLPSRLNIKFRRKSADLVMLERSLSQHGEPVVSDTDTSSPSPRSPAPPKIDVFSFEKDLDIPSSQLLTTLRGEPEIIGESVLLPGVNDLRQPFGRSRSSPMLKVQSLDLSKASQMWDTWGSTSGELPQRHPASASELQSKQSLTLLPSIGLDSSSDRDDDWVKSVLLAAATSAVA